MDRIAHWPELSRSRANHQNYHFSKNTSTDTRYAPKQHDEKSEASRDYLTSSQQQSEGALRRWQRTSREVPTLDTGR